MRQPPGLPKVLDTLTEAELLALHKEVCRRVAPIYEAMYGQRRETNYRAAMAIRPPQAKT